MPAANRRDYPPDNFYCQDLWLHDSYYGNPPGTRAAALVGSVADKLSNDPFLSAYVATTLEGQEKIAVHSMTPNVSGELQGVGDMPPLTVTVDNYPQQFGVITGYIGKLDTLWGQAKTTNVVGKVISGGGGATCQIAQNCASEKFENTNEVPWMIKSFRDSAQTFCNQYGTAGYTWVDIHSTA